MFPHSIIFNLALAIGIFAGLLACLELWFFFGNRARVRRAEHPDQLATIQGAMLGLLALLLGFSFALAAGRFSDRVDLIVKEANAIGTAMSRSDLLPEAERAEMRAQLRQYTAERIAFYDSTKIDAQRRCIAESEKIQSRIWGIGVAVVKKSPELTQAVLPPLNELMDLHGARVAAAGRQMPAMLIVLLLACSLVSVAAVGYGCGVAGKRNWVMTTSLTFLIAGTLWAIIDMDHPRDGLIRAGQQPMLDLQRSLEHQATP